MIYIAPVRTEAIYIDIGVLFNNPFNPDNVSYKDETDSL